jgi:amidase
MTTPASLPFSSAIELLRRLESRELSSRELLDLYLSRIEAHDDELGIVVEQAADAARAAAAAVDDARASGAQLGPLAGLPMTIKDAFEVVGMTASCGLPDLADHRPEHDAVAVERLRRAGAVIFGKTNTPPGAADWQTYNTVHGLTSNPWNRERTVGGSSGGSAASVAAGFTSLELGSDIAGSIRVPSHFCGVFGHKPSYGVVPVRGHIPPLPGGLVRVPLGVAGPIARSAADLELALDVLAGPDELDATAWSLSLPACRHERLDGFRVGLWLGGGVYPVDGAYREAIEAFAGALRAAGVQVEEVELPFAPDEGFDVYLRTLFAIVGQDPQEAGVMAMRGVDDETGYAVRMARAMRATAREWFGLLEQREHLFRAWRGFFADHDVLLCPVATGVAFPHDIGDGTGVHSSQLYRRLTVNGAQVPYFDTFMWPGIATNADLPATVMPTGRFVGGLPAGVQVIGPYLEDRTTIGFARLAEQELGGFTPPPPVSGDPPRSETLYG